MRNLKAELDRIQQERETGEGVVSKLESGKRKMLRELEKLREERERNTALIAKLEAENTVLRDQAKQEHETVAQLQEEVADRNDLVEKLGDAQQLIGKLSSEKTTLKSRLWSLEAKFRRQREAGKAEIAKLKNSVSNLGVQVRTSIMSWRPTARSSSSTSG